MAHGTTELTFDERGPTASDADRFPRAPGVLMALLLLAGLLLAAVNPALREWPEEPLIDGSWAAAYQERFDTSSHLFEPAMTIWGVLDYALFRQGRAGLLVGEEEWLYSSEEFSYPSEPLSAARTLEANLDLIAAAEERLASQGVRLVVALLPAKARVYPEHLGRYRLPDGPAERFEAALSGLRQRGVRVVNLLPPLLEAKPSGSVFLRTDTHWTPFGARVSAAAIAITIAGMRGVDWLGEEEFETSRGEPRPFRGDLTGFLPLGPFYDDLGPADDLLASVETNRLTPAGNDLFAEVEIPTVLVGTSYSQDERWNFAGWLREALGSDVLVAAERGEGPFEPMVEYLEGEAFRNAPPEVVVWEVPERYLDDEWRSREDEN